MSWDRFYNFTDLAERMIRIEEGACLLAATANRGPVNFRGQTFTYSQLAGFAASGRIMVFSLDIIKDIRDLQPSRGDDMLLGDLFRGKLFTLKGLKEGAAWNTVRDGAGLVVDVATVSFLLTDALKLIPRCRITILLDRLSEPALIVFLGMAFCQDWSKDNYQKLTKSGLDLFHALVLHLLPKWADAINPLTLVATGLCGGVVASYKFFQFKV